MRPTQLNVLALFLIAFCCLCSSTATAKARELRFQSSLTGDKLCLDIFGNDKERTTPAMQECGNYSGMAWHLVETEDPPYVKLKNEYSGAALCLDIITVGKSHVPAMAQCGKYTGQYWKLEANAINPTFKLKNMFSGEAMCLEILMLGADRQLVMATCSNLTGQMWRHVPY
jgi:hypothetical protein